jgi:hypothetical protein
MHNRVTNEYIDYNINTAKNFEIKSYRKAMIIIETRIIATRYTDN